MPPRLPTFMERGLICPLPPKAYVPEGTIVSVPIYAQHLDEQNFGSEPARYDPRRWMPGGSADPAALMAFGAGACVCSGV